MTVQRALIHFSRDPQSSEKADMAESAASFALGHLRVAFGKTVEVCHLNKDEKGAYFQEALYGSSTKTDALIISLFTLPLTLLLGCIGAVALSFSHSHAKAFKEYEEYHKTKIKATKIQKLVRGHLARRPFLPKELYSLYKPICQDIEYKRIELQREECGKTAVYLPNSLPHLVLKHSGKKEALLRFEKMQKVRDLLAKEEIFHLVIPQARVCGNFLIEKRFSISANSLYNMALYIEHKELFDDVVRDMTKLFSKIYIDHLVSRQILPLGNMPGAGNFVRYDNLPFLLIEEKGEIKANIALIDLDHVEFKPNRKALQVLAKIFPYHLDIIKQEADRLNIEIDHSMLSILASQGKKYLKLGYLDHLSWIQANDARRSSFQISISHEREKELSSLLAKQLFDLNEGVNPVYEMLRFYGQPAKDFLSDLQKDQIERIASNIVSKFIENIHLSTWKYRENESKKHFPNISKDAERVNSRSCIIERRELYEGIESGLFQIRKGEIFMLDYEPILEALLSFMMDELVKGGEIYHFDPAYYSEDLGISWIRY
ncbi:MAG: hypothetical protein FJZ56_01340 [Chlamydiae bacterium]|nr:hypothetical protein [Chlamydiota bacterium]